MKRRYNYLGQDLGNTEPELASSEFGYYDPDGSLIINWSEESDAVDKMGFDKLNKESNGQYKEDVELPKGTMLCRYGSENGKLTTLKGTDYDKLGLPYKRKTVEYHEYMVVADGVSVKCIVTKGIITVNK